MISEKSQNILNKHRRIFEMMQNDNVFIDVDGSAREELIGVIRAEINSGYITQLWCGPCVFEMVKIAYSIDGK